MVSVMKKCVLLVLVACCAAALFGREPGSEARARYDRALKAVGRATVRSELKTAAVLLEQAKAADPGWAEVHFALGRIYMVLDVYDRAGECYERYLVLSPDAPDREEAVKQVRICRVAQELLDQDKRLMASGIWARVRHSPPVRFNEAVVASRFRIDSKGRLSALNPCLEAFGNNSNSWVKEKWLPVAFDGKHFEYRYTIYFKALDPPRTEYMIETVRGEVIHGPPLRVRQEAWTRSSPTAYLPDHETLRGEVLHAVR